MADADPHGPFISHGTLGADLKALFAALPATVWMTDDHLTLTFLQGQLPTTLNLDLTQIIGRSLPALLMDGREDHPLIQAHLTALAGRDATVRIEWGGDLYHTAVTPLRDAAGRMIGCVGVQQRIGWMPHGEGTLRESDIRLRRIIDSNMIGIVFGRADGEVTDANEAFLKLTGYVREDLVTGALTWSALTPIESHPRQVEALDELRQTGTFRPFEFELLRKDGSRVPVLAGGARLSADRREGVAFVLDISDRRRATLRIECELACADALADAASIEAGAAGALEAILKHLSWRAAALWLLDRDGRPAVVAMAGLPETSQRDLDRLGRSVCAASEARWLADAGMVVAPVIVSGKTAGALACIGPPDSVDPEDLTRAVGRLADRFSKHLRRVEAGRRPEPG